MRVDGLLAVVRTVAQQNPYAVDEVRGEIIHAELVGACAARADRGLLLLDVVAQFTVTKIARMITPGFLPATYIR